MSGLSSFELGGAGLERAHELLESAVEGANQAGQGGVQGADEGGLEDFHGGKLGQLGDLSRGEQAITDEGPFDGDREPLGADDVRKGLGGLSGIPIAQHEGGGAFEMRNQ